MGYIIVGDTERYKDCLVTVIHGDKTFAEEVLDRLVNHPTITDRRMIEGHTNLRLQETEEKDEWWNDPFLAN